jgi:hypothetical protein
VLGGALTNQAYRIRVVQVSDGTVNTYNNTLGTRAPAIADTGAFPCSP